MAQITGSTAPRAGCYVHSGIDRKELIGPSQLICLTLGVCFSCDGTRGAPVISCKSLGFSCNSRGPWGSCTSASGLCPKQIPRTGQQNSHTTDHSIKSFHVPSF